ncbi:MAG TPA: universal stress protein [Thermoanaerobaculia bacterium]|nr:universal stress protein [Thermoanaerobaculia bacterium]
MNGFKRILVPTDLSEVARVELDYALLFADTFGADLTLFYADPMHFEFDPITGAPVYVAGVTADERARLMRDVRAYAEKSLRARPYDVVVGAGDPVATITREARETRTDLIVMATHGQRGWRRTAMGSVTEGVVHEAPCPVLSVARTDRRHGLTPGVTRVVCPVNFTDVARESLRTAASIAKMFACELVIAHVVETPDGTAGADETRVRSWVEPEVQSNCTYREIILRGGAAERILDYVEDIEADLLVIGAQRKLFRDSTVIGTTTERMIRFARVPVLSVVRSAAAAAKAA